ncbi:unnamed protein product [Brassica rapa subsp. trilocularis]|nr:unnamed protein product [Brassica napus]
MAFYCSCAGSLDCSDEVVSWTGSGFSFGLAHNWLKNIGLAVTVIL